MLAAQANDLAGRSARSPAEHVVGGHAVFQAMHAAGILRDVAADGAGDLRGRIGRVVEALMRDGVLNARLVTPGSTTATRLSKSISRMRLNLAMPSSTPSASGSAPPDSEVPAPRGTTRMACAWQ